MEKEADFGRNRRICYLIGIVMGNLFNYYFRCLFYSRMSFYSSDCPFIRFTRPWMGTLVMTIGIAACTLIYYVFPLIDPTSNPKFSDIPINIYLHIALLALLDILISVINSFAIAENSGSISVAFRCFDLLFIIIIENVFVEPIHYAYQWVSLGIVLIGNILVTIGVTVGIEGKSKLLTSILLLFAQLFMSIRSVLTQRILHNNDVSPWLLTGINGIYGFFLVLFGFYPIANFLPASSFKSLHENFCSSVLLTVHSTSLIILFLIYIPISFTYNVCITGTLMTTNAVGYTIFEMISGAAGWIIDLIIYHAFHGKFILKADEKFGTKWDRYSFFRLFGSLIFLMGGAMYLKVYRFSCFKYPTASVTKIEMSTDSSFELNFKIPLNV